MDLALGAVLQLFATGRWSIPLATWLAPVFLLRFSRGGHAGPRLSALIAVFYVTGCASWWGMVPVSGAGYFAIVLAVMLPQVVPYLLDRLLVPPTARFASTFVFPSAWVLNEFVVSRLSPYGSWGVAAYTQVDHLPLIQSAALVGLWGVGFLVAWTAAVAHWAWQSRLDEAAVRKGVLRWAAVLAAVLLFGGARLALAPPPGPTVRMASFTLPIPDALSPWRLLGERLAGAALDTLRAQLRTHHDTLFEHVRREAASGSRLVMWSEANAFVLRDEVSGFETRAAAVAREAGVLLVTGAAVFMPGEGYYENVLAAYDSTGRPLARYHKARPVPGDPERGADRAIPVFATGLGRIAGAICFDADFPDLLDRAGRERADLLLIPASDWRAIDPLHTRMALLRGVENGCSVVRQTNKGLSAAADLQGRVLASADFFRTRPAVMVAQVPVHGVPTPYARFPLLAPLLCAAVLVVAAGQRAANRGSRRP